MEDSAWKCPMFFDAIPRAIPGRRRASTIQRLRPSLYTVWQFLSLEYHGWEKMVACRADDDDDTLGDDDMVPGRQTSSTSVKMSNMPKVLSKTWQRMKSWSSHKSVVLCGRCGPRVVGCRREGAKRWAVPGIYCASLPPSLSPSDAPRSWAAHSTRRRLYCSAPLVHDTSLGSIEAEFRQAEAVSHDSHVLCVSWHASRTSRGGLRSRTLLSTQHIIHWRLA
jgi:hypothetical protein